MKWSLILLSLFLVGCQTSADSVASSGGVVPKHPDLPANYRQQIAEFMRTQLFAMRGIRNAEIAEPSRAFAGLINGGDRDIVCIRFGGTIRGYVFVDGKLNWDNGGVIPPGYLLLLKQCGENPIFKPFPEADFEPSR